MSLDSKLASLGRLWRTLADVGPVLLQRRFRYEIRQRFDSRLPPRIALAWAGAYRRTPEWRVTHSPLSGNTVLSPPVPTLSLSALSFSFLNQERELPWPIPWNDRRWPRLWQFHLHYFDWARQWLKDALISGHWPDEAGALQPLLDTWLASNPPGRGDGWHSYTLSLRTRNWIALFQACPALATPERLKSLWQQLCWLEAHPENCYGGNHWLENLTALAIGGLQFDGTKAIRMHRRAMHFLQLELRQQVLSDGGHEERSASYHLLMLDRLAELAHYLNQSTGDLPSWLVNAIEAMANWAHQIRLESGEAPRFNDSASDSRPPLDVVLASAAESLPKSSQLVKYPRPQSIVTDLPATGWSFLRPGHGWELVFKCGIPCPSHLPPHVHSDQLGFELCHHGRWVLSEAGTSIYEYCPERAYERSGAAHNVLQLGVESEPGVIRWIEPVDVWGGFRAGRKAQPRDRSCGQPVQGVCFASGSHNGFDHIGASHHRRVTLINPQPSRITFEVLDTVITRVPLFIRHWVHLGPDIRRESLEQFLLDAPTLADAESTWNSTLFAIGFGRLIPRQSHCLTGRLPSGNHQIKMSMTACV